jgi:large subunit ribosomal protein L6
MSRVGNKPVPLPKGVDVTISGRQVALKGPKGSLTLDGPPGASVTLDDGRALVVTRTAEDKQSRANHGLVRALLANMVRGVTEGFQKRLQIHGTGYNCKLDGRKLHLNIGYMGRNRGKGAQFELTVPEGIEVVVETPAARGDNEPASLVVRGIDRQKVGQFAAEIHSLRRTEPYKGKGIRYDYEVIKRKQGKALSGG